MKTIQIFIAATLEFDERDGTFHFERPDRCGEKEFSEDFIDKKSAMRAYEANKLEYS